MDNPKLIITSRKYTGETSIISMRIPKDMLKDIDKIADETGRTRNELLTTCLDFSLKNMEILNDEK